MVFDCWGHNRLQKAKVIVESHKDLGVLEEWLADCTLSKVHRGKVLVQLINLGTSPVLLPNHTTIADLYMVHNHCIYGAQPEVEAVGPQMCPRLINGVCNPLINLMQLAFHTHSCWQPREKEVLH